MPTFMITLNFTDQGIRTGLFGRSFNNSNVAPNAGGMM
jgi:hypothetical protein